LSNKRQGIKRNDEIKNNYNKYRRKDGRLKGGSG
jgi:hypothetical protein